VRFLKTLFSRTYRMYTEIAIFLTVVTGIWFLYDKFSSAKNEDPFRTIFDIESTPDDYFKVAVSNFAVAGGIPTSEGREVASNYCNELNAIFLEHESLKAKAWLVPGQNHSCVQSISEADSIRRKRKVDAVVWGYIRPDDDKKEFAELVNLRLLVKSHLGENIETAHSRSPGIIEIKDLVVRGHIPQGGLSLTYMIMTYASYISGRPTEALRHLTELLKLAGNKSISEEKAFTQLALFNMAAGPTTPQKLENVKYLCLKALAINEKNGLVHSILGSVYLQQQPPELDSAAWELAEAVRGDDADKNAFEIYTNFGNYFNLVGKKDTAAEIYRTILAVDSNDLSARVNLGVLLLEKAPQKPQSSSPRDRAIYREHKEKYCRMAASILLPCLKLNPGVEVYNALGNAYAHIDVESAIVFYNKALAVGDTLDIVRYNLLELFAKKGLTQDFFKKLEEWSLKEETVKDILVDDEFRQVRKNPRFKAILKKKGVNF